MSVWFARCGLERPVTAISMASQRPLHSPESAGDDRDDTGIATMLAVPLRPAFGRTIPCGRQTHRRADGRLWRNNNETQSSATGPRAAEGSPCVYPGG